MRLHYLLFLFITTTAEEYHQDYYIKNPANYGYYKNGCRRPQRLKEVWGIEEYKCFHEESHTCFIDTDGNMTSIAYDDDIQGPTVINADGEVVAAVFGGRARDETLWRWRRRQRSCTRTCAPQWRQ